MQTIILIFDVVLAVARPLVFGLAVLFAVIALLDWLVRTRRINPFGGLARFVRRTISPIMAPVERRVVRSGGLPTSAPWWALVVVVIGGIVLLSLLGFVRDQILSLGMAASAGPGGMVRLLVSWIFAILQIAILVRVFSSLFRVSPYSKWVRWSYTLSEPILRPLRGIVPPLGMFDITPIIAYFLLSILQWAVLGVLRGI